MNVLVIPEDFRKDQYMLKPLMIAMLEACGKKARVRVCQDPLLGGVSEALKWERIAAIIDRYPMVDLFILCVDRDGQSGRKTALVAIEKQAAAILPLGRCLLAENAWQEIEVWVLAGHDLPNEWNWQALRTEVNPKEYYFLPFAQARGFIHEPGEGRKTLAQAAARRYTRICQLCPELAELTSRIP